MYICYVLSEQQKILICKFLDEIRCHLWLKVTISADWCETRMITLFPSYYSNKFHYLLPLNQVEQFDITVIDFVSFDRNARSKKEEGRQRIPLNIGEQYINSLKRYCGNQLMIG